MSVVAEQLAQTLEEMDTDTLLSDLGFSGVPFRTERSLTVNRGRETMHLTLPRDFWEESEHTLDNAGDADIIYWREHGIMIVDVGGEIDE